MKKECKITLEIHIRFEVFAEPIPTRRSLIANCINDVIVK